MMAIRKLAHKPGARADQERWFASLDAAKDMVRLPVLVFSLAVGPFPTAQR